MNHNISLNLDVLNINYRYIEPNSPEWFNAINLMCDKIASVDGHPTQEHWESAWKTNKDNPQWFNQQSVSNVFRYNGQLIKTNSTNLEQIVSYYLLKRLYHKIIKDNRFFVEFGCGTGHNIEYLCSLGMQRSNCFGSDFTTSSLELLKTKKINSFYFDICNSSIDDIPQNLRKNNNQLSVMTLGSLEQIGNKVENFISVCKSLNASTYIHIEPLYELHSDSYLDKLSKQYHDKRDYLKGFVPALQNDDSIEILQCSRLNFGTLYNEGYNILIWRNKHDVRN